MVLNSDNIEEGGGRREERAEEGFVRAMVGNLRKNIEDKESLFI